MDELCSLESRVEEFKKLLVNVFDWHCDSGLYALKDHLPEHMLEDIRRLETLYVLDSSQYKQIIVPIKETYKRTFQ